MRKLTFLLLILLAFAPTAVMAQTACSQNYSGTTLCNALPSFGSMPVNNVPTLIIAIFAWLASVLGTIALVMIMFGGAQMIFSRGDAAAVTTAKRTMTYAIGGLVVIVMAYVAVSIVQNLIGYNNSIAPGTAPGGQIQNPLSFTTLTGFVTNTMKSFLSIIGTVTMLYVIVAGFRYVMAGSNEDEAKKARAGLTWAILGLVSIILSYAIVSVVLNTIFNA